MLRANEMFKAKIDKNVWSAATETFPKVVEHSIHFGPVTVGFSLTYFCTKISIGLDVDMMPLSERCGPDIEFCQQNMHHKRIRFCE